MLHDTPVRDDTPSPSGTRGAELEPFEPAEPAGALERCYRWASAKQVRWQWALGFVAVVLLAAGSRLGSGYATYSPGPAPAVAVAETVEGPPSEGAWHFTTVEVTPVSVARYLWGLVAGDEMTRVTDQVGDTLTRRGAAQMRLSQEVAWAVANDLAAGGGGRVSGRAVVTGVEDGSAAAAAGVRTGDAIVSVDGTPVGTSKDVPNLIADVGRAATLGIERDGTITELQVVPQRRGGKPKLGVTLADRPAEPAGRPEIRGIDGIGGPSAGLMFTLAYLDSLTGGDLTGGRVIAGTGTMSADGEVGRIDGVAHKVQGALEVGAEVFFSPSADAAEAASAARGRLEVIAVDHVTDAIGWLCAHGGESRVCQRP